MSKRLLPYANDGAIEQSRKARDRRPGLTEQPSARLNFLESESRSARRNESSVSRVAALALVILPLGFLVVDHMYYYGRFARAAQVMFRQIGAALGIG